MIRANANGNIFNWTRRDGYVTLEWYDGLDVVLDAGMDRPTVWGFWQTYIDPIDYIDLLSAERPTELCYRITEFGDRRHPGTVVVRDLDWMAKQ